MAKIVDATERKKIGKYEIKGILGRGGMGVVYLGEDERIGREVAIKTLTEGYNGQPELLKMFYREAKAGFLQHPHIVMVYDMGDEDGLPYIVMELAKGEPLKDILTSRVQLPLIDKLTIIDQVCMALGYAHSQGVIHRDIKPANVMVKRDPILAKLVDFGIAKVESAKDLTRVTKTGNVLGTITYMAPERLRGQQGDGRVDLFATGVMLYQLLAGRLPFDGETDAAVMQKLLYEPHQPLSNFLSNYPPQLDAILDRALTKEPEGRYHTAEEFSADLHGLIDTLKKAQIDELFSDAERLTTSDQYVQARDLLNQLVRIDPQHTAARRLLTTVNNNLAKMQRAEQIRGLMAEAEGAVEAGRFIEALTHLEEAASLDTGNIAVKEKIEEVRSRKQRQEEIQTLMTRAESLRGRGDLTGALVEVERALRLNENDTYLRAVHGEMSRQVRVAAQREQVKQLLGQAKSEMSAGRFTKAIECLREVDTLDPESAEAHAMLQAAIAQQEQERRRKVLEQIVQEIQRCVDGEDWERAADLLDRSLEKLPAEATLLQLKTKVALQLKKVRLKQQIDAATTQAQQLFPQSPSEALLIVQKAIQELGADERLLALETSLRERMQSAEKEEIRNRYLRDAQEAIDQNQFEKAVKILESYQYEFSDASGVEDLLEMARNEVSQQQRRERVTVCAAEVKALMENEQYTKAIRVLEPVSTSTGDPLLNRLLSECRQQVEGLQRKTEALLSRVERLRERGEYGEAIEVLEGHPSASEPGSKMALQLAELRTEQQRKQARDAALAASAQAAAGFDFSRAIAEIEKVQRSWGDAPELSGAIKDLENRRKQHAVEKVTKALEAARAALADNKPAGAQERLKPVAGLLEIAGPSFQNDWNRLNSESDKLQKQLQSAEKVNKALEAARAALAENKPTKAHEVLVAVADHVKPAGAAVEGEWKRLDDEAKKLHQQQVAPKVKQPGVQVENWDKAKPKSGKTGLVVGGGLVAVVVLGGAVWVFTHGKQPATPAGAPAASTVPAAPAAPPVVPHTATIVVQGNVGGANVYVDNVLKDFTQADGSLRLTVDPGKHTIKFGKSGYTDSPVSALTLAENDQKALRYDLVASSGPVQVDPMAYVAIHSTPGAAVTLNNEAKGVTNDRGELMVQVKPGSYTLGLAKSGFQSASQGFAIKAGEHNNLSVYLSQVIVHQQAAAPLVVFSASTTQIVQGQAAVLSWSTSNASEVTIEPGIGRVDANNQREVYPQSGTTYTLTAKGDGGTQQRTVSINVGPKPAAAPQPAPQSQPQAPAQAVSVDPRPAIQAALNSFYSAFNAHDTGKMKAVWAGMTDQQAKNYDRTFKDQPKMSAKESCAAGALNVTGDSADWTCTETTTIESGGKPLVTSRSVRFSFVKRGSGWTITDRR